jgi:tetratricopeptide (TPR) repeat protein
MRGNRTLAPSYVDDRGALRPLRFRSGPRAASRRVLDRVDVASRSELLAELDALVAEHPTSAMPRCHRGELLSWLGDYEGARADLEGVIVQFPKTRWAYIGLATLDMVAGDHARALETLALGVCRMDDTTGVAVYGVRGEALRRLGRLDEAIDDLETARALRPNRLSAWINLALAYRARGRVDEARRAFEHARARAYPLFHDAARELGAWVDDVREPWDMLERSLELMLANRNSVTVTWRSRGSAPRILTGSPTSAAEVAALRAKENADVRAAIAIALRGG